MVHVNGAPGGRNSSIIRLRPPTIEQLPASLAHRLAALVTSRARYAVWVFRRPTLRSGPPFRVGPRARFVLTGAGKLERGKGVVIAEDFSLVAQAPVIFGDDVYIDRAVYISSHAGVTIGDRCRIGERVSMHDDAEPTPQSGEAPHPRGAAPIDIGAGVVLEANSVVQAGVTIGHGSVIRAGSVVAADIPPGVVAAGSPAQVIITDRGQPSRRRASRGVRSGRRTLPKEPPPSP